MWEILLIFFAPIVYIAIGYFSVELISKHISKFNIYSRLIIISFCYALFWGIGISATGGDPGFGFPAPNIIAIGLMIRIGYYSGAVDGLIILAFWWILIFVIMYIRHLIKMKKNCL